MANNLTGLNAATRVGDGIADVMTWGNLDRAANRLYAEQKQKEAQGLKEAQLFEQELSKDFSKIRSADVNDIMAKYQKVKAARQKLLFDQKIKSDPIAYAEQQKIANLEEQDLRSSMLESMEVKEDDKSIPNQIATKRDFFDDEKLPLYYNALNMPTAERKKLGLIGVEPYRYTGIDMKGLGALSQKAMGSAKEVPFGERKVVDGGFNYEQGYISRTNDPVQYASLLYKDMQSKEFSKGARASYDSMTPQQIQGIRMSYNAIPDAEFEARWGRKKQDLEKQFNNADDKVQQYVLLDAMKYATDFLPKESKPKKEPNVEFKREQDYQDWLKKNKITDSQATRRAYISRAANGTQNQPVFYYDSYGEIEEKLKGKKGGVAVNELSATTQDNLLKIAKSALGDSKDNSDITVYADPNTGEIGLYEVNKVERGGKMVTFVGDKISKLTANDLNYSNAPSVKERREIAQKQNQGSKAKPQAVKKVVGKKDDKL